MADKYESSLTQDTFMPIHNFVQLLLIPLGLAIPIAAQETGFIDGATLNMVAVDHKQNVQITGRATFDKGSISFESPDIVFTLPTKDVKAVEYKGTRDEFLTLTIVDRSKFIELYPFLCLAKTDAYHRRAAILVMSLAAKEPVDSSVKAVKGFQSWIARQNEATDRAMVAPLGVSAEEQAGHPFLGTTTRVVIAKRGSYGDGAEYVSGLLTFFPDRLEFNSRDLNFALRYAIIEGVQCAGARDTFLTVRINPRDDFVKLYGSYRHAENRSFVPGVRFSLEMSEEVAPAYKRVLAFQQYMEEAIAAGRRSMIGVAGSRSFAPPNVHGPEIAAEPHQADVLLTLDAYYLEKKPGAIMGSFGKPGQLVIRDDGIGFVFSEPGKLSADRQQAAVNSRIFIPMESLNTATVREQKLLPGMSHTMFWVVLKPKLASQASERLHPFLSTEGELIFTVRTVREFDRVSSLLARFNAAGF